MYRTSSTRIFKGGRSIQDPGLLPEQGLLIKINHPPNLFHCIPGASSVSEAASAYPFFFPQETIRIDPSGPERLI